MSIRQIADPAERVHEPCVLVHAGVLTAPPKPRLTTVSGSIMDGATTLMQWCNSRRK